MGIFGNWGLATAAAAASNVTPIRGAQTGVISPWQTGSLSPIIASDLWGLTETPMTMLEMLRVPAVNKGRAVLHSLLSRPLRTYDAAGVALPPEAQPTWLYRTNTGVAPQMRTKLMLDDFIFHDSTLLQCDLGKAIPDAPNRKNILDAWHVDFDRWSANDDGSIEIDSQEVDQDSLLWIPGPGPGLLLLAAETARGSRRMAKAWVGRVENPFGMMELHETEDTRMDDDELAAWLEAVRAARAVDQGAFFTPYNIEAINHSGDSIDLFESGRNAERIDWANYFAMPASLLDGSLSTASLTYSTQEGKRNEVFDYTVPYWLDPLTSRLSLDDVTPRGTSIQMDFTDLLSATASPSGPTEQD